MRCHSSQVDIRRGSCTPLNQVYWCRCGRSLPFLHCWNIHLCHCMSFHQKQADIQIGSYRPECHCRRYMCGRNPHCLWCRDQIADKMFRLRKVHSQNDSYILENYHQVYSPARSHHCSRNKHQMASNVYHQPSDHSQASTSKCENHRCCCNHDDSLHCDQGTHLCQHMIVRLCQVRILSGRGISLGCPPIHTCSCNLLQCMDFLHQL